MDLSQVKLWGSLQLDKIKEAAQLAPKKFKKSEQYGNQMTFDAKQWDDGGISLSVSYQKADGNWERINIGNIRISNDQSGAGSGNAASASAPVASESPFDSPF